MTSDLEIEGEIGLFRFLKGFKKKKKIYPKTAKYSKSFGPGSET